MAATAGTATGEHAPAKVNLALHVTGQRDDGFHLIETLAVFTAHGDTVSVLPAASDSLEVEGPFAAGVPLDGSNLVLRARDLLRRRFPVQAAAPVAIRLRKALPVASGIGGGSSDAAAALRALCRFWGISPEAGIGEAGTLGADLPMCLHARPLLAGGIGERIVPLDGFPTLSIVLVNPGVAVSTPQVFRALASRHNAPLPALPDFPSARDVAGWLETARNDLQAPATALAPQIADAIDELSGTQPLIARMSGSGATCFALYGDAAQAEAAASRIADRRPGWFTVATRTAETESPTDAA